LKKQGLLLPRKGYRYKNEEGLDMVELHHDELPGSKLLINIECCFGGILSVRRWKEKRPIFSLCQNECILLRIYIYWNCMDWTKQIKD